MQWAQIDVTGGTIATTPVQQQIYAPGHDAVPLDGQPRRRHGRATWRSATARRMERRRISRASRYSGRLATDPLNTLPQTEVQLIAGAGSQTNNCGGGPCDRWGDYSAMSVDPADDCTFWYTNEYYEQPGERHRGQLAHADRLVQVPAVPGRPREHRRVQPGHAVVLPALQQRLGSGRPRFQFRRGRQPAADVRLERRRYRDGRRVRLGHGRLLPAQFELARTREPHVHVRPARQIPIVGDWNGDGDDSIGALRSRPPARSS